MSYERVWMFRYCINGELVAQSENIDIIPEEYRHSEELKGHVDDSLWNYFSTIRVEPFYMKKEDGTTITIVYEPVSVKINEAGGC